MDKSEYTHVKPPISVKFQFLYIEKNSLRIILSAFFAQKGYRYAT